MHLMHLEINERVGGIAVGVKFGYEVARFVRLTFCNQVSRRFGTEPYEDRHDSRTGHLKP